MSDRSLRWGILPRYFGYRGDVVETQPHTEEAVLSAMGAASDRPPRARRHVFIPGKCLPPPAPAWGWAVQVYAPPSPERWPLGALPALPRPARWPRAKAPP